MGKEFSPTSISRFSTTLDAELDCWRERVFTREYLYVVADARYESCREYEQVKMALDKLSDDYRQKYPDLANFVSEHGWETLGVYYACPVERHKRLRTTNMIERINQELKRRSRVVRIFPNLASCRRLFTALLKEWHEDWISGRAYLNMDLLKEFELNKHYDTENNNRVFMILQKKVAQLQKENMLITRITLRVISGYVTLYYIIIIKKLIIVNLWTAKG